MQRWRGIFLCTHVMSAVRACLTALQNHIPPAMCAPTGSLFISYTIKSFGALVFAIIMTTRQFLSILLSSLFFGSPLTLGQW